MKVFNFKGEKPGEFTWKLRVFNHEQQDRIIGTIKDEDQLDEEKSDADSAGETGEDDPDNQSGEDRKVKVADFLVYGEISDSPWDSTSISPKKFADALAAAGEISVLNVRIHSLGGNVLDAQAIYNTIQGLDAQVNTFVDGMAASSASIIALAGDTVVMRKHTWMMIHNPFAFAMGDSEEMRKQAEVLDAIRDEIAGVYHDKTGLSLDKLRKMMDEETWMNASKAKRLGFADEIRGRSKVKSQEPKNKIAMNGVIYNLAKFHNVPLITESRDDDSVIITKDTAQSMADTKDAPKKLTIEEIKSQYPDVFNQIVADAGKASVEAERTRLADLEELNTPATAQLVAQAKADGKKASDIMKACFEAQKNFKAPAAPPVDRGNNMEANRLADAEVLKNLGGDASVDKTQAATMRSALVDSIVRHGTQEFNMRHASRS
jgi:ATP-dependent protease ClpP protease subunit